MINIHSIEQACAVTTIEFGQFDVNKAATKLLAPFETPDLVIALMARRERLIDAPSNTPSPVVIAISSNNREPKYLIVNALKTADQLLLFLQDNALLTLAFGQSLPNQNSQNIDIGAAIIDDLGRVIEKTGQLPKAQACFSNIKGTLTVAQWTTLKAGRPVTLESVPDEFAYKRSTWVIRAFTLENGLSPALFGVHFSSIETDNPKADPDVAPFSLTQLIEETIMRAWDFGVAKGLELALNIHPTCDAFYYGDRNNIGQILFKLVANAIKYTEKGGVHVTVDSSNKADPMGVVIRVIDSGTGFAENEQANIFKRSGNIVNSKVPRARRTELNLSSIQPMLDVMSGTLDMTSSSGKGSEVVLFLPLEKCTDHRMHLSSEVPSVRYDADTQNSKIIALLDCDNEIVRTSLTRQLEHFHIPMCSIRDLKRPLPTVDIALVIGEPDNERKNIAIYKERVARFVNASSVHYICTGDVMHTLENDRKSLYEGFSQVINKPLLPSKLSAIFHNIPLNDHLSPSSEPAPQARILVVEDGVANREVALALLEIINIRADVARNGIEAVDLAEKTQYPLILMDLSMPEMGGLEATKIIRSGDSVNNTTPIIALTANTFAEDKAACMAAGMNDFISKPIDTGIFNKKIAYWLSQKCNISTNKDKNVAQPKPLGSDADSQPIDVEDDNFPMLSEETLIQLVKDTSADSLRIILDIYFKEVEQRIPKMEELYSQQEWDLLGKEAHALKSSSASFGAKKLSAKAQTIEACVKRNNVADIDIPMRNIGSLATVTVAAQREFLARNP